MESAEALIGRGSIGEGADPSVLSFLYNKVRWERSNVSRKSVLIGVGDRACVFWSKGESLERLGEKGVIETNQGAG